MCRYHSEDLVVLAILVFQNQERFPEIQGEDLRWIVISIERTTNHTAEELKYHKWHFVAWQLKWPVSMSCCLVLC